MWPNFKSPLLWDVFAVSTYFTVSALFWFVGLIPDLATLPRPRRARAGRKTAAYAYGVFALGWHGSNRHWINYEKAYLILAGLSTPLVLSVHSIVSFDFAVSLLPGWHTTIFPPYFVAGAIFSGFGMVLTLMIPARAWLGLHDLITLNHLDNIAKVLLLTGTLVGYAYGMEFFIAWYSGVRIRAVRLHQPRDRTLLVGLLDDDQLQRDFAAVVLVPVAASQPDRPVHRLDLREHRYVVRALRDHGHVAAPRLPARRAGTYFSPTVVDVLTYLGSFGLFFTMFLLFVPLPADHRDQRSEGRHA